MSTNANQFFFFLCKIYILPFGNFSRKFSIREGHLRNLVSSSKLGEPFISVFNIKLFS